MVWGFFVFDFVCSCMYYMYNICCICGVYACVLLYIHYAVRVVYAVCVVDVSFFACACAESAKGAYKKKLQAYVCIIGVNVRFSCCSEPPLITVGAKRLAGPFVVHIEEAALGTGGSYLVFHVGRRRGVVFFSSFFFFVWRSTVC